MARVRFDVVDDMSAMLLLTDGITDPLFDSDTDLNGLAAWNRYWKRDVKPLLGEDPVSCSKALLESLDFWSRGNHDDRTIAVLYKKGIAESQQASEIETADMEQGDEPDPEDTQTDAELAVYGTSEESADQGSPEPVDRRTQESTVGPVNRED